LTKLRPIPRAAGVRGGPVVIGAVSRLVAGKGIDVLLRSLALLRKRASVLLLIAGDGTERNSLQRLATRLGVDQAVEFLGWIDDLPGFWARCDIAATPSDTLVEAFGLSAVEPMACALPVVATRNGGLSEVVEHEASGLLVPPGDAEAVTAASERYILSEEMGNGGGA